MRIFIAAPFGNRFTMHNSYESKELREFIEDLILKLRSLNYNVFSAHELEEFGSKIRHYSICTPFDFLELRRSDVLIGFPSSSGGVHIELGWGSALGIPIILLSTGSESALVKGLNTLTKVVTLKISNAFPLDRKEKEIIINSIIKNLYSLRARDIPDSIAFISTAFGYGPASKAVTIAQEFRRRLENVKLDFYGSGIDNEFALSSQEFDNVINLNADDTNSIKEFVQHSEIYDHVFSIMNFKVAQEWKPNGTSLHLVDSLAWMWPSQPDGIDNVSNYFIQEYLTDKIRLSNWKSCNSISFVGPICRSFSNNNSNTISDSKVLLINFSGCANPMIKESLYIEYAITLSQLITNEASKKYNKIIISVQNKIAKHILQNVEFQCTSEVGLKSPKDFIHCITEADCILTTPGITTTLELLINGKRPSYLLAQNYSQALINEYNLQLYPDLLSMAFSRINSDYIVPYGLEEEVGVKLVASLIENTLTHNIAWIKNTIHDMLNVRSNGKPAIMKEPGQKQIVNAIYNF